MRFIFDENLSPTLVARLKDLYPGSIDARHIGIAVSDLAVWEYAVQHGCAIISKDSDFSHLAFKFGPPPKVVWLRCGNRTTDWIEQFIRDNQMTIEAFLSEPQSGLLTLP